ncbi:STAS domain-containing protein [Actinomycetospora endophytica]|uniref:STAS domain-containing protein n=1 Tax=Actinomycetospora endophytica TaxID=2291215 RepID=A0ABS8PFD0_9PSEU|nr:STAS domain-containing protein [Actinomycetospora endophytica]MCD2196121.1 STAS domain-containing protein [Actinomycetospora endophytica]
MGMLSLPRWPPAAAFVTADDTDPIGGSTSAVTVMVVGAGDRITANHLARYVDALVREGARHLIVDVSAASDCGCRLLTVLARARADLVDRGGALDVTGVSLPQFLDALQGAGPDEVFVVYDALRARSPWRRAGATGTVRTT